MGTPPGFWVGNWIDAMAEGAKRKTTISSRWPMLFGFIEADLDKANGQAQLPEPVPVVYRTGLVSSRIESGSRDGERDARRLRPGRVYNGLQQATWLSADGAPRGARVTR